MKIEKISNDYGSFDINMFDYDKVLLIYQVGQDITVSCFKENYEKISNIDFDISKDDSELFSVFNNLYEGIIQKNLEFLNKGYSISYGNIVEDNRIKILSDAYPLTCPNTLEISRTDDNIHLHFDKADGKKYGQIKLPYDVPIHIRMSGSKIGDFSILFKNLFDSLQNISIKENCVRKRQIL